MLLQLSVPLQRQTDKITIKTQEIWNQLSQQQQY